MEAIPLICFPPAGASAGFYRPWRDASPAFEVVPVELPGRELRFAEEPVETLDALVAQLSGELGALLADAPRAVFFGHSFGAVLAYETLRSLTGGTDTALVVSGSAAPGIPRPFPLAGRPDDELVAGFRRIAEVDDGALDDPEIRELVLPLIRADIEMHEGYRLRAGLPLTVPVLSLRGSDDPLVTRAGAEAWRSVSTGPFRSAELPGGHMYLRGAGQRPVIERLESVLTTEWIERVHA